jgi:hypothetical protein
MTPRVSVTDPWRFEPETRVLALYDEGRWIYEVDLERCRTSAGVLDWIMQVASKTWATDAVIAGLARGLKGLLNPQATLCSFGIERGPLDIASMFQSPTGGRS